MNFIVQPDRRLGDICAVAVAVEGVLISWQFRKGKKKIKIFCPRDDHAIKLLQHAGIIVVTRTHGRYPTRFRGGPVDPENVLYVIGTEEDLERLPPDSPAYIACPGDASRAVVDCAHFSTIAGKGHGVLAEIARGILMLQGKYDWVVTKLGEAV